jgi:hypothetical protein
MMTVQMSSLSGGWGVLGKDNTPSKGMFNKGRCLALSPDARYAYYNAIS